VIRFYKRYEKGRLRMKHVMMKGPKTSIVTDIQDVKHNDDEILIKLKYVGVCTSEHYDWSVAKEGAAFGHEPMGIIEAVGKNVTGYKVGDRVSGLWGSTLPGSGGMVEYAVADPKKSTIVVIPDDLRDTDAILEPLACIMSAVSKVKIPMPGTRVCVVGAGYMGCGAIGLLKTRGAYVVAIDIRPESVRDAKKYGADEAYLVDEAKEKFLSNLDSSGKEFDVVMEWGETEESLDLAINLTNFCGQLCIGAYHTGGKRLVDVQQLNMKAIECLSTHPREMHLSDIGARNAVKLLSSGEWNYTNVPTKVYPRNKFDQAQEELETKYGKYMKAVIDMTAEDFEPYII
jgi:threonine dehydrogenase-like Zn-dependent dehydrogenase